MTLTLNPAVDRSGNVHGLAPSEKLRCTGDRTDPGGGGINVARVLTRLGADATAIFPTGGLAGDLLVKLIEADGIRFHAVPAPGETRESFSIKDTASGAQYRFVFPGAPLAHWYVEQCCYQALHSLHPDDYLIVSGSLPPGTSPGVYGMLAREACARGAQAVLDCSGEALRQALGPHLTLVKVNQAELEDVTGMATGSSDDCVAAARHLLGSGTRMVAVTRGSAGALLVSKEEAWDASAPAVQALSTVGAGDSFLAALVWSLAGKKNMGEALRLGVAAGSAALLTEGTGLCWLSDIHKLMNQVQLRQLTMAYAKTATGG